MLLLLLSSLIDPFSRGRWMDGWMAVRESERESERETEAQHGQCTVVVLVVAVVVIHRLSPFVTFVFIIEH